MPSRRRCRICFLFARLEINAATKFQNSLHCHCALSSGSNVVRVNRSNSSNFPSISCLNRFRIFVVHLLSPALVINLGTERLDQLLISYPSAVRIHLRIANKFILVRASYLYIRNFFHTAIPITTGTPHVSLVG